MDKILHFFEYYVLGYLVYRTLIVTNHKILYRYMPFLVAMIGILYGISDEWHQAYVPGRDSSAADVLFDGLGVILAVLTFKLVRNRIRPLFILEKFLEETLKNEKRISHHH